MNKQKRKTGVAILGVPLDELNSDPKFQGPVLENCVIQGEIQACAALTIELAILDVAGINRKDQKSYTGRSQYPRFKNKPIIFGG